MAIVPKGSAGLLPLLRGRKLVANQAPTRPTKEALFSLFDAVNADESCDECFVLVRIDRTSRSVKHVAIPPTWGAGDWRKMVFAAAHTYADQAVDASYQLAQEKEAREREAANGNDPV